MVLDELSLLALDSELVLLLIVELELDSLELDSLDGFNTVLELELLGLLAEL